MKDTLKSRDLFGIHEMVVHWGHFAGGLSQIHPNTAQFGRLPTTGTFGVGPSFILKNKCFNFSNDRNVLGCPGMRLTNPQLDLFRKKKLTPLKVYEPKSESLQCKSNLNTARHISGNLNCSL